MSAICAVLLMSTYMLLLSHQLVHAFNTSMMPAGTLSIMTEAYL